MRILVPTDMTDRGEDVLRRALEVGDCEITLLHAEPMPLYPSQPLGDFLDNSADARRDAAVRLRDYAHAHIPLGVHVETTVIDDVPARAIVETADHLGADLIVMGDGALTDRVRRMTTRPVMTVSTRSAATAAPARSSRP